MPPTYAQAANRNEPATGGHATPVEAGQVRAATTSSACSQIQPLGIQPCSQGYAGQVRSHGQENTPVAAATQVASTIRGFLAGRPILAVNLRARVYMHVPRPHRSAGNRAIHRCSLRGQIPNPAWAAEVSPARAAVESPARTAAEMARLRSPARAAVESRARTAEAGGGTPRPAIRTGRPLQARPRQAGAPAPLDAPPPSNPTVPALTRAWRARPAPTGTSRPLR